MATKKILYLVTQSEWGGAQKYIFDLATHLNADYQPLVAAGEGNGELFRKCEHESIRTFKLKHLKRAINPLADLLALLELIRVIKRGRPNVIHLNSSKISILGSLAAKLVINPQSSIIYTAHGWVFNEPLPSWKKKFYLFAEKWTARFKDKVICVSDFDKQVALDNHLSKEDKLITIHNGINYNSQKFLDKNTAKQKLFSILESPVAISDIIGTIANLYKTKGLNYLITAAAEVIKNRPDTLFLIIGEGPERPNLEQQIKNLNLKNNFFLLGNLNDAYQYSKAFDLFILPSVKEGFPYTLLEAMAARVPVVATNVGGVPEIIKNNINGLLVQPKNSDQLAKAILKLLNDRNLQQKLINNIDLTEFSLERMVKETEKLY